MPGQGVYPNFVPSCLNTASQVMRSRWPPPAFVKKVMSDGEARPCALPLARSWRSPRTSVSLIVPLAIGCRMSPTPWKDDYRRFTKTRVLRPSPPRKASRTSIVGRRWASSSAAMRIGNVGTFVTSVSETKCKARSSWGRPVFRLLPGPAGSAMDCPFRLDPRQNLLPRSALNGTRVLRGQQEVLWLLMSSGS